MLEFGPFLLKSSWSSLTYFSFNDAPTFSIQERSGRQAGQFSTRTLLLRIQAVVQAAICGFALSCLFTQGLYVLP